MKTDPFLFHGSVVGLVTDGLSRCGSCGSRDDVVRLVDHHLRVYLCAGCIEELNRLKGTA